MGVTMLAGRNAWYGRQLASGALTAADGDFIPGKGHIQGPSTIKAFAALLSHAMVPLGPEGELCRATDLLPTLKGLDALLSQECSVQDFVESMHAESQQDPSERLLSAEVYDGFAFIPSLLAEPFLADDRLAAMGIDVKEMDSFRKAYGAFRVGEAHGASGEAAAVTLGVRAG